MLYGELKSAGSCGHFKFHTKRDATFVSASLWNLWLKRPQRAPLVQLGLARQPGEYSGE
jgi:hypothetical protein